MICICMCILTLIHSSLHKVLCRTAVQSCTWLNYRHSLEGIWEHNRLLDAWLLTRITKWLSLAETKYCWKLPHTNSMLCFCMVLYRYRRAAARNKHLRLKVLGIDVKPRKRCCKSCLAHLPMATTVKYHNVIFFKERIKTQIICNRGIGQCAWGYIIQKMWHGTFVQRIKKKKKSCAWCRHDYWITKE